MNVEEEEEDDNVEKEDRSQDREAHFVRACAVEKHMDISHFVEIYKKNARRQSLGHRFVLACASETHRDIHKSHFVWKFTGRWPDTDGTTLNTHRAIRTALRGEKSRGGKSQRREEMTREEERRSEKKEDPGARKGRKIAIHNVFPTFWGSGRSESRLATATGAEPPGQVREEQLHGVLARSTFRSKTVKTRQVRSTFGS